MYLKVFREVFFFFLSIERETNTESRRFASRRRIYFSIKFFITLLSQSYPFHGLIPHPDPPPTPLTAHQRFYRTMRFYCARCVLCWIYRQAAAAERITFKMLIIVSIHIAVHTIDSIYSTTNPDKLWRKTQKNKVTKNKSNRINDRWKIFHELKKPCVWSAQFLSTYW